MKNNQINKYFLLIVFCVATAVCNGQDSKPANQTIHSLLYKISGNNLTSDSYILFTANTCEKSIKLSPKATEAISAVKAIAVENNLYDGNDADKMAVLTYAKADSERITNNLIDKEYDLLQQKLVEFGIPADYLKVYNTFAFGIMYPAIMQSLTPCADGHGEMYESFFLKYAKKNKLSYVILQNADNAIAEFRSKPNNYWKKNILYLLNNPTQVRSTLSTVYENYGKNNVEGIKAQYASDKYFQLQYDEALFLNHQDFLANSIKNLITTQPAFISLNIDNVFLNSNNILQHLKKMGYLIEPIMN